MISKTEKRPRIISYNEKYGIALKIAKMILALIAY